MFQKASARWGKKVAFLGVDVEDSAGHAAAFLANNPVPYPSYVDPHASIASALHTSGGLPDTVFFNRRGEYVFTKIGQYSSTRDLEEDIERYAR